MVLVWQRRGIMIDLEEGTGRCEKVVLGPYY